MLRWHGSCGELPHAYACAAHAHPNGCVEGLCLHVLRVHCPYVPCCPIVQPRAMRTRGHVRILLQQGCKERKQRAHAFLVTERTGPRSAHARCVHASPCRLALLAAVLRGPEPARYAAPLLQHHGQPALLRRVDPARRPASRCEQEVSSAARRGGVLRTHRCRNWSRLRSWYASHSSSVSCRMGSQRCQPSSAALPGRRPPWLCCIAVRSSAAHDARPEDVPSVPRAPPRHSRTWQRGAPRARAPHLRHPAGRRARARAAAARRAAASRLRRAAGRRRRPPTPPRAAPRAGPLPTRRCQPQPESAGAGTARHGPEPGGAL